MLCLHCIGRMIDIDCNVFFCFQAEDGIRDLVRSRGLGDVYKRQAHCRNCAVVARTIVDADGRCSARTIGI